MPTEAMTCSKCATSYIPSPTRDFYEDPEVPGRYFCEKCITDPLQLPPPVDITVERSLDLCRKSEKGGTCRFLVSGTESVFACAKNSNMHAFLNGRALEGKLKAQGDNCTGPPDFKPLE